MIRLNKIIFILVCMLFLTGCYTMYIPVLPNTPLFKNRNEFQSEACLSPDGLHGKLAFSPIKHIGININGQYSYNISPLFGSNGDFHEYIDGSLGFYSNYKNKLFFEIYFGYGNGVSRMNLFIDDDHYFLRNLYKRGFYNKEYGQINLAIESKSGNQFGLSNRYGYINYKLDIPPDRWIGNNYILHTTWEPTLFYVIEISKKLRITFYAGAFIVSGDDGNHRQTIFTNRWSTGVGLKLVIGRKENK